MAKNKLFTALLLLTLQTVYSEETLPLDSRENESPLPVNIVESKSKCDLGSRAMQVTGRHAQGTGIGYSRGYTTLEGFFSPKRCQQAWVPFVDLRGHVFNNSTFAAN